MNFFVLHRIRIPKQRYQKKPKKEIRYLCKKVLFDKTTIFETGPRCFEILKSLLLNLELKVDANVPTRSNFKLWELLLIFCNNCGLLRIYQL